MEPRTCPHPTCAHTWTPRKAEPKKCPQCQNPLWRSSRPKRSGSGEIGKHGAGFGLPRRNESEGSTPSSPIQFTPLENWTEETSPAEVKDSLSEAKARAEALFRALA